MSRRAGIVMPLFSLRSRSLQGAGVGEIADLAPFAEWMRSAGFSILQILPVMEPARGQSSPYAARTAFAMDPVYLRVEDLEDFAGAEPAPEGRTVDWKTVRERKERAIRAAFGRFREHGRLGDPALKHFREANRDWLDDYALYAALHEERGRSWDSWEEPLRERHAGALDAERRRLADKLDEIAYTQWQLDRQWREARRACEAVGVELMGDLPFVVAGDSADVWSRRAEFRTDVSAGAPPDAFSATGQEWGLPVFDWTRMASGDFDWMRRRAARTSAMYALYRVDHVVGLYRTYTIAPSGTRAFVPVDEPAQLEQGERVLGVLRSQGAGVIAEDLGVIPDFVRASLNKLGVPGYRVLRWENDGPRWRHPSTWPACSVATTGTHDTESVAEWYETMDASARSAFLAQEGLAGCGDRFDDAVRDRLLAFVLGAPSEIALVPFQDLFGHRERVNVPGTVNDENWTYRMPTTIAELAGDRAQAERLARLARESQR